MNLYDISLEMRDALEEKRKQLELSFIEEDHIYYMRDLNGEIKSNFPSVSRLISKFHKHFDSEGKALQMCKGDPEGAKELLAEWKQAGDLSTNMGSRVHFELETDTIDRFGKYKNVRQPIFDINEEQQRKSDAMIGAGKEFLDLMLERGGVLLDTEMVLGDPEEGYTGQPDKVWLVIGTNGKVGILITDWKSNKPKNFEVTRYTKKMKKPFEDLPDNALGHYNTQLPFYGKLILKMLEGSKYEDIQLLGCIIVLITDEREYHEHRVSKKTMNKILEMDIKQHLTKLKK